MAFEFKQGEPIPKGVRRIVCKRIDKALKTLNGRQQAVSDSAVHDARKRFKEIRGTLRLVRDELGNNIFRQENQTFRDAGRPLSQLRDAKVLLESLDAVIEHFQGRVKPESLGKFRRLLLGRRRAIRKRVIVQDRAVFTITRIVSKAKKRVENWPLHNRGWKAIKGGLRATYGKARNAMKEVADQISDEALHEWRKRTKDLRYELELLQCIWPQTIEALVEQAHRLTDLLGDDHDLSVLSHVATEEPNNDDSVDAELLMALVNERREALQKQAISLGEKLYEENADQFVRRIKGYWKSARKPSISAAITST